MRITRHRLYGLFVLSALAVILPAVAGPALAQPTDWYVDGTRPAGGGGTSWADAYEFLQDALHNPAIVSGDRILVAGGTYFPDDGVDVQQGEETEKFRLKNGVRVEGGYHGYCTFCSDDLRDETSVLSGDIEGGTGRSSGDSQHVVWAGTLAAATVLDRFTIEWGNADETSEPDCDGGGLYVLNCSDFTVSNCTFQKNHAREFGGAVWVTFNTGAPADSEVKFEDCDFDDNDSDNDGGAIHFFAPAAEPDQDIRLLRCEFTNNRTPGADGRGAAMLIDGAGTAHITFCDFINNTAGSYGALTIGPLPTTNVTLTDCTFDGNTAGQLGAAIYLAHISQTTIVRGTFKDNTSAEGGGAIWLLIADGETGRLDLDDCKFLRNKMTADFADHGGGAVFMDALSGAEINGKWTNCRFIENSGYRGGAAYLKSCKLIEIEDCVFVANRSFLGGGALCMSDKSEHGTPIETRICNSIFVSNSADDGILTPTADNKGGAVYSRFGATTTMVNCIIAGNFAEEEGGGTCNADGSFPRPTNESRLDLHNCLIIGNECETNVVGGTRDVGGGHFNRDQGKSEVAHCTIVGNKAGYQFGGLANRDEFSLLKVRNSIIWDNTDVDGGSDALDAELHYDANNLNDNDVDANLIHDLDDDSTRFDVAGGETEKNQEADPVFEDTSTTATWTASTFDPDTGLTTFTVASITGNATPNELFFKPDTTVPQLLIKQIVANTSIICWGKWANLTGQNQTGSIFDYHIDASTSNAVDYGETANLPGDDCDLDNDELTIILNKDLDLATRDVNGPDSGAYEVPD